MHDRSLSWLGKGTSTTNTHIHDRSLSWLGKGTSIKGGGWNEKFYCGRKRKIYLEMPSVGVVVKMLYKLNVGQLVTKRHKHLE
jgi:hypothetical protein